MKLPPVRRRPRLKVELLEDRSVPATLTVTTLADGVNPNDGLISLNEAIIAAESDAAPDLIDFDATLAGGTISLASFDTGLDSDEAGPSAFNIRTPITILGSGQVLQRDSAGPAFRHFFVASTGSLTLENLELSGGLARGGDGFGGGGGAAGLGGSIFNAGTLTIRNSTLTGNSALGGDGSSINEGPSGGGGGMGESATDGNGGGPNGASGGGSINGGFGGGGAAFESAGGNGGFGGGGGAGTSGANGGNGGFGGGGGAGTGENSGGSGGFGATRGFVAVGGGGAGMGGAVFNSAGQVHLVNTTIVGNITDGGRSGDREFIAQGLGGGLFNLNGSVEIANSTFSANQSLLGGSLYNLSHDATGGVPAQGTALARLANSIFENSTTPGGSTAAGDEIHNLFISNAQTSGGSFLATLDVTSPNITNGGGLVNANGIVVPSAGSGLITESGSAITGSLALNGGPTRTLAIFAGSSAEDAGDDAAAVDPGSKAALEFDQRGDAFPRNSGESVDLGAFEIQVPPLPPPLPVVNVTAPDATADENVDNTLVLKFTRTGDTSSKLTINYLASFNGLSAADILDAQTTGGSGTFDGVTVTFAAGSDAVTTTLTLVNDIHAEGIETVSLTVLSGDGYEVGDSFTAEATVLPNDFVVINTNDAGEGSLRQAVLNAEAIPGADTVTFIEALDGATIRLFGSDGIRSYGATAFSISTDVTIRGSGQIITRDLSAPAFRFFYVFGSGNLTLENLELNDGLALGGSGIGGGGGAAGLGGAIFNRGSLTIRNSTLVENFAQGGHAGAAGGGGGGGGLGGDGQIGPDGAGGGINGGAGGAEGSGQDGGFGGGGGGDSVGEPATGGNGGFGGGGGGTTGGLGGDGGFGAGAGASLISGTPGFGVIPSGESDSRPEGGAAFGGAIFNYEGDVRIINSTITGNTARGGNTPTETEGFNEPGYGGGLFNLSGTVEVRNSTFAGNRADVGGSLYNLASEIGTRPGAVARAELFNSIFTDSVRPAGSADSADEVHNNEDALEGVQAEIVAAEPNITNGGGFVNEAGTINSQGVIAASAPVVSGTLAANGGFTRTLALLAGSEAIDAGNNDEAIEGGEPLEFDQRGEGFPRVFNDVVDLGAFERQIPPGQVPDTIVITAPDFVVVQNGPEGGPEIGDPFPDFDGENLVAVGDVNRDGVVDYIFAAGDSGGPRVQVFSGADGSVLYNFFAFDRDFRGGVYIATGDLDGDGYSDIITGAGMLGGPHIRAFSGQDGSVIANFFAFNSGHRNGVTVAVGDVNGDGQLDIIAGSGPDDGSEIRIFDGTKIGQSDVLLASLFPYAAGYRGGVFVAAGNLNGDRFADIVAGPLAPGGTTQTVVFDGATLSKIISFFEDEPSLYVGIRFAIADANGDGVEDMVVVAAKGGGPRRIVVNPLTGEQIENTLFDDADVRSEGYGVGG